MNRIDRTSNIPMYIQLEEILIEQIQDMEIGSQLDTEREICEKYNVSRTTTRQALDELANNEYIIKIHGKGNFVANKYVEQKLVEFYSFTDEMKRLGKTPKTKYIGFGIEEASDKIAEKLQLAKGDLVYSLCRLRFADDMPMMYGVTYLPYNQFPDLSIELLEASPLYDVLRKKYNVSFAYAEELFQPILINKLESFYLKVPEGMPGLKIERFTYIKGLVRNQIIEYTKSIARGDTFKYRICLENK